MRGGGGVCGGGGVSIYICIVDIYSGGGGVCVCEDFWELSSIS